MTRGRKNTPKNVKVLKGTFREDRANDNMPDQAPDGMRSPTWLPVEAVEYFGVLKSRIEAFGLNSSSYTETLAMAALRLADIDRLTATIEKEGGVYKTKNIKGDTIYKSRPEVAQRNESLRHLQGLLAEFGLNPSAIQKIGRGSGGAKNKPKSKWAGAGF